MPSFAYKTNAGSLPSVILVLPFFASLDLLKAHGRWSRVLTGIGIITYEHRC